jgi:hypothetical protein
LIIGVRSATLEHTKHTSKHEHALFEAVAGTETVGHPSDCQLLAYAKKHCIELVHMQGDSVTI